MKLYNKEFAKVSFGQDVANGVYLFGDIGYEQRKNLFNNTDFVIIKNETSFRKPVRKNIVCHTKKPSLKEIEILKQKLETKKSASIKIESKIIENGEICVEFEGYYVIKL